QEEIRQVFEGSCHLIPLAVIEEECVKLSDQFIPELIDTLASQMNPQAVCATAGLCNSARIDRLLKEEQAAPAPSDPAPGDCKDCKAFLKDVIDTVKRHSRSELLDHLLAICGHLSSLSDGCMALVQSNFQSIYDFLANGLRPNEVCELFGMCEGMFGTATVHFRKTEDEPCDFCVAVVKSWRNNLASNTTKDEFKMILSGICHQTGKFEGECLALVDQYFEDLYELMMSEIDPKEICSSVGLCGANSVFKNQVPIWPLLEMRPENHLPLSPMHPSFDANDLIGQDEANSYRHNIPLPRVSLSKSSISVSSRGENGILKVDSSFGKGDSCVMCEFVLHFLQNVLSDKVSRKEIEDAVENVCHLLPHTLNEECQDYIEAYGDQLIQLIVLEIDPSTICPMLKLCPGKQVSRPSVSDSTCVLCEYAMTELDEILEDKSNEESIKEAVEQICSVLPKSISSQCKTFVDDYIEQIVDLIVNGYTPREICGQLGLCPALSGSPLSLPHPKYAQLPVSRYFVPNVFQEKPLEKSPVVTKQSTICVVCEFVVSKIDSMILDNSTEVSRKGERMEWMPSEQVLAFGTFPVKAEMQRVTIPRRDKVQRRSRSQIK
ncbi:UNVERIFIED_CONTAM: hypothetical protein GTU68_046402, partial [Idotea baltica]|nr:hypothetical protein [Idotea baltica]